MGTCRQVWLASIDIAIGLDCEGDLSRNLACQSMNIDVSEAHGVLRLSSFIYKVSHADSAGAFSSLNQ